MLDLAAVDEVSPEHQLEVLLHELGNYDPTLLERPRVVIGTKADSASHEAVEAFDGPVISAITTQGVRQLVLELGRLVDETRRQEPERDGVVILRPEVDGAWVERLSENEFRVHGRAAERSVALNDVSTRRRWRTSTAACASSASASCWRRPVPVRATWSGSATSVFDYTPDV